MGKASPDGFLPAGTGAQFPFKEEGGLLYQRKLLAGKYVDLTFRMHALSPLMSLLREGL